MSPPAGWTRVKEIFAEALELPPKERRGHLDEACGEDSDLRSQVEELLESHDAAGDFLVNPALPPPSKDPESGWVVGPYRTLRELGRGGMGAVYLGQRADEAFQKQVALKVIKRGMDTDEILRRFRNERQILANLDHPGIARLLDGGSTEDGRPYFAMEHVDGLPVDRYCKKNRLTTRQRLKLFRQICDAVQFAHQNLIVHRDLKPNNILVTAEGQPKLLDFGIAKLLDPGAVPHTVISTGQRGRLLTPDYASPEQIHGKPVTTASDVYSLGVLLYEILTGSRPYHLESRSPQEISQAVEKQHPPKPSTVVHRAATVAEPIARGPAAPDDDLRKLSRQLKGDLDTIVMMAMHKEPGRRYASAEQLSEDLRRHLVGLPVVAREDTPLYLLGKFMRRNKGASVAALLLVCLTVVMTWQRFQIAEERDRARQERSKAEQIRDFLLGVFEIADPGQTRGETITAREILEAGTQRLSSQLLDQPLVRAEFLDTVGGIHYQLGLDQRSIELLREALEARRKTLSPGDPEIAETLSHLGDALLRQGEVDEAERLYREALETRQAALGQESQEAAESLNDLATVAIVRSHLDEAEAFLARALKIQRSDFDEEESLPAASLEDPLPGRDLLDDSIASAEALGNEEGLAATFGSLAAVKNAQGEYSAAAKFQQVSLVLQRRSLGESHPDTIASFGNLAALLFKQGEYEAARPIFEQALKLNRRVLGDSHTRVATTTRLLGSLEARTGNLDRAEELLREAVAIDRRSGNVDGVTDALNSLAVILNLRGNPEAAQGIYRELLVESRRRHGDEHPEVAQMLHNLGMVLLRSGSIEEAQKNLEEALALRRGALGEIHPDVATTLQSLGLVHLEKQEADAAEPFFHLALAQRRELLGEEHPFVAFTLVGLARVHLQRRETKSAYRALEEALAIRKQALPEGHWRIAEVESLLGIVALEEGRFDDAEALLGPSHQALVESQGSDAPETRRAALALDRLSRI